MNGCPLKSVVFTYQRQEHTPEHVISENIFESADTGFLASRDTRPYHTKQDFPPCSSAPNVLHVLCASETIEVPLAGGSAPSDRK